MKRKQSSCGLETGTVVRRYRQDFKALAVLGCKGARDLRAGCRPYLPRYYISIMNKSREIQKIVESLVLGPVWRTLF